MATKTITLSTGTIGTGSGNWVTPADTWPATSWNGDSGAVTQAGFTGPRTYLTIGGGMDDGGTIPANAIVDSLTYSFNFAITAPAGNSGTVETGFGTSTPQTWSGNTTGACADTVGTVVGLTWADAAFAPGWLFKADSSAQAGGSMRIVITNFAIVVNYTPVVAPPSGSLSSVRPPQGASTGGETVTLQGHGFVGGIVPTFDGLPATEIVVASTFTLTCAPPPHEVGAVDVAIAGYGTLAAGYRYVARADTGNVIVAGSAPNLPPIPATQPPIDAQTKQIDPSWLRWLNTLKSRVEAVVGVDASQIVSGLFAVSQIPTLPWTKITKTGSSLADLETRNAGDLTSGMLPVLRLPPYTGDVTSAIGTAANVLADGVVTDAKVASAAAIAWSKLSKVGSSLADLATRSASDLASGVLAQAFGGTGRANAYSQAPGSFTVADGTFAIHLSQLQLTTAANRVTVLGTGRLGIL